MIIKGIVIFLLCVSYALVCQWLGLGIRFAEGSFFGCFVGYALYAFTEGQKVSRCQRCAEEDSRNEKAMAEALKEVEEFPDDPNGHYDLGWEYEKGGMLEIALAQYHQAKELADEADIDPLEFRAACQRITKKLEYRTHQNEKES
jgi:tetratricopeptide (TPR) repeat protein